MTTHVLKCWPNAFDAVKDGRKRFEWRRDDRGYEVGDVLVLRKWDPAGGNAVGHARTGAYVTHAVVADCGCVEDRPDELRVVVTYILRGQFGVPENYCVMSIEPEQPR